MHRSFRVALATTLAAAVAPLGILHGQEAKSAGLYRESYVLEAKRDYAGALAKVRDARAEIGRAHV